MALNHLMHPLNIYKRPPDFRKLADTFPEFASITKFDATGKITIDFKDPHSLRILTKCLMKSDFDLDIDIPEDRLVPTLPLRLNYILWVDDIATTIGRYDDIWGIDIGTGACAIYTLLGASMYCWNMIGTETDEQSLRKAQENIDKNSLGNSIKLKLISSSSVIEEVLNSEPDIIFDFSICNPPFYSNVEELCESRHPSRQPPKNAFTGSPHELITEGGELEFCKKMLKESMNHRNRVRVFTTMVGHKFNFKELVSELQSNHIKFTHTTFCQGRVTRWGLAWTYQDYKIESLAPSGDKVRKNNKISYVMPALPNTSVCVNFYTKKIQDILTELEIDHKMIHKRKCYTLMQIEAFKNTWSHQRRKRRLLKRIEAKRTKLTNSTLEDKCVNVEQEHIDTNDEEECKEIIVNNDDGREKTPIINARMTVSEKDSVITLQFVNIGGSGGKDVLHQILQYIKNNWK